METSAPLSFTDGELSVVFSALSYPHDDALALYTVTLSGPSLDASACVEGVIDDGLAQFLADIGGSSLWEGERSWRALTCVRCDARVDQLGHVTLAWTVDDGWRQRWSSTISTQHDLGDFPALADAARRCFSPPWASEGEAQPRWRRPGPSASGPA